MPVSSFISVVLVSAGPSTTSIFITALTLSLSAAVAVTVTVPGCNAYTLICSPLLLISELIDTIPLSDNDQITPLFVTFSGPIVALTATTFSPDFVV